jgi:Zn-dependent protease
MDWLTEKLYFMIPLIISLTVHEFAHAWSAFKLGDSTAADLGRLTLDPSEHIDPIGTLLLPLLGVPFGWAKPVPINPLRFRRDVTMRTGLMLTAAAGPISNLVLAVLCGVAIAVSAAWLPMVDAPMRLLFTGLTLNITLFLLNLLPVPPLDGSRVADRFMPESMRPLWEKVEENSGIVLMVLFVGMSRGAMDPFSWPVGLAVRATYALARLLGA